ncbi:MAG TPA: tetratricopeptide repeat protein [Candidatus Ozemobacteraceae bacterium]|nr:tetratricopeptide repeat protein [Candidatus Ozemobacteraceae bacterium]
MKARHKILALVCVFCVVCLLSWLGAGPSHAGETKQLEVLQKAVQEGGTEADFKALAGYLGKSRNVDDAVQVAVTGLRKYPSSTGLLNLHGLLMHRRGRPSEALSSFRRCLEIDPNNSFAREWISRVSSTASSSNAVNSVSETKQVRDPDMHAGADIVSPSPATALSPEDQEKMALQILEEVTEIDDWNLEAIETRYRRIIETCPQSRYVPEVCWRLSNLYLYAWDMMNDQPNYDGIIEILSLMLEKYPVDDLKDDVLQRLAIAYEKTDRWPEAAMCQGQRLQLIPADEQDSQQTLAKMLLYADSLRNAGKLDEAQEIYRRVVDLCKNDDSFLARMAQQKITATQQGK